MNIAQILSLSFREAIAFDIISALVVHGIYKRFEIDPSRYYLTALLTVIIPVVPVVFLRIYFSSLLLSITVAVTIFYTSLFTSIVLYRISPWHPLASYPGPLFAKTSKFWAAWITSTGKNHIVNKKLHEKYGPFVRVGPNEISICDVDAVPSILGPTGMPKGPQMVARRSPYAIPSLITLTVTHEHTLRRKRWNRGFSSASVKEYEPVIIKRALQLVDEIRKQSSAKKGGLPIDLALWLSYFTFDFMGDMAFGGGFELMRDGKDTYGVWNIVEEGLKIAALVQHFPWLTRILYNLPMSKETLNRMRRFARDSVKRRKEIGHTSSDLFHHLADEDGIEEEPTPFTQIESDGMLAIIAGSDTTATVMAAVFYFLLTHREIYQNLREEVDSAFPLGESDPFNGAKLADMAYLNAVINETLRLQPAVPSGLQRSPEKGTGGHWIGDKFIPEGIAVNVAPYSLHRDPRYFSPSPEEFIPERWLPSKAKRVFARGADTSKDLKPVISEFITNTAAFIPFSTGPANCVGRNLAIVEMRMVITLLVQRFEMRLADGYDPREWFENTNDWFVVKTGQLPVILTPRA